MIHPSYKELIDKINMNAGEDEEPIVTSRYSIVLAASKRARQLTGGSEPLIARAAGKKPLSIAVQELYEGKINILPPSEEEEETEEIAETAAPEIEGAADQEAAGAEAPEEA